MHALLQTVGNAEVQASWGGLQVAVYGVLLGVLTPLGIYAANYFRGKGELTKKELELAQSKAELQRKEIEFKQLEVDEKIRAKLKVAAADAAAIAQETSYGRTEPLSGPAKAELAADKLRELAPDLADADRSKVQDLVKIGVAQLRQSGAGFHIITPSMAPPPEQVLLPKKLPAPAAVPANTPATKTSPERPGAKR